jgi:hypothetical protein
LAQQNEIPIIQKFKVEKEPIPEVKPIEVSLDPQIDLERLKKSKELLAEKLTELQNASIESLKTIVTDQLNALFENSIQTINDQKDAQLTALDEQDQAYQDSYDKRLIGKRELDANLADSNKKRVEAEKKAEKELNEIRKKQDIAKKAIALFDIALSTSKAVMAVLADPTLLTYAKPGIVAATIATGAIQAAAVLAQPLPKYKKGTLSVGGVGSEDTELALLQPGEAVIPTEINRKYHPAIKAIYNGNIKPEEINNFVNMKLKRDYSSQVVGGVTAKMDVADLYTLGRIMKKNDGVVVKNIGELAELMSNQYNPRR